MGAIADGSYKRFGYGNKEGQYNLAVEVNNSRSGHTTLGVLLSTTLPSIFMNVAQKAGESSDSDKSSDKEPSAKEIQKQVNTILEKYDVNSKDKVDPTYSDVKIALVQKQSELATLEAANKDAITKYDKKVEEKETEEKNNKQIKTDIDSLNTQLGTVTTNLQTKNNELKNITKELEKRNSLSNKDASENQAEIKKLVARQQVLTSEEIPKLEEQQQELQQKIEAKETEKSNSDNKIQKIDSELTDLKTEQVQAVLDYRTKVEEIQTDLKTIEDLTSGDIDSLKNDQTEKIVTEITNYKNAKTSKDKADADKNLKAALELYYRDHKIGKNPTIDRIKTLYESGTQSGSSKFGL